MIPHLLAGVAAGVAKVGALVHHAVVGHATLVALVGAGGIVTLVYLDYNQMNQWYSENPPQISIDRAVKIAIAGNLVKTEFRMAARNEPMRYVLQGYKDAGSGELLNYRIIKPQSVEPTLAKALSAGQALAL